MIGSQFNFKWSLDLLNAFDILNGWTDTSVAAEDSLLLISDDSSQWHLFECLIDLGKDTVWIGYVFSKTFRAFITEAQVLVDVLVFMVTSEKHDLLWIFQLQSEEEANDFETVMTLVDIVTQEKVVISMDITSVGWSLPDIEESHQVYILTVDITNNLDWWSDFLNHNWLSSQNLCAFVCQLDNVLSLAWKLTTWLNLLTFLWFQQWLEEHLAKSVIWIFINLGGILLLWVQLLWLLSKLVDGNLSNNKRKVLGV